MNEYDEYLQYESERWNYYYNNPDAEDGEFEEEYDEYDEWDEINDR